MIYGYGDLNYKDRLSLLELPSLEERRVREDLIEAFKLLKGIANLDYSLFFKLSGDSKVTGHTYKIVKNSFAWMLENISLVIEWWDAWNELPQYVVDEEILASFKARLDKFYHKI